MIDRPAREPDPDQPDRNILRQLLRDLAGLVQLLEELVTDDAMAQEAFGFSLEVGAVSELTVISDALSSAADGNADLEEFTAAAARLAELTDAVNLLVEAVQSDLPAGLVVEEAVGLILDTLGTAYVAARWPMVLYLARLLGLVTDNISLDAIGTGLANAWDAMTGPLESDEDARKLSAYLAAIGVAAAYTPLIVEKVFHRSIDPLSFQVLQGWEHDPHTATPQADRISERFVTILMKLPAETVDDHGNTTSERELVVTLTLALVPREHGGPGLWVSLGLGGATDLHLGSGWHLVIEGELADGLDLFLRGRDGLLPQGFVQAGGAVGGKVEVHLERRDEGTVADPPSSGTTGGTTGRPAQPWRIGSVLEVKAFEFGLTITDREPMLEGDLRIRDAAVVIPRPGSGFFRSLVPEGGLRLDFSLALVVDSTPRYYLEGGAGLEVTIPIRTSSPAMQGLHLFLALRNRPAGQQTGPALTFEASGGFGTRIGAFSATVDRLGVILPESPHGLSGAPWLKLPSSVGIGIDGDVVKGGGFILFDADHGRYAGMLSLTIGRWSITAFGLLTDLTDGYSLLLVLSIEWDPALSGPFGISLAGIGGVIGHNHGADVLALQASMRTGAVRTMLFPADPALAAPKVLTTLGNVFPVRPGSSLIGLGLKLTWSGGLVSLVAAVIVESGPTPRIVILASLEAVAPTRDLPVVRLRWDAVGIIDTRRPSVEIDGSLVDSFIGPYSITGDATFRFRGGDDGIFLLAVGGFHPSYVPPPSANLPPQRRITLALPSTNPRLRLEHYWAVTSNSIQMGARLEVSARKGGFSAEALLGFDALVERRPFHLEIDIQGRAAIRYEGSTLAGVDLDLHVDGPSPWHVIGKAKLSLLFFSVTIPIHYDSGDDNPAEALPSADAAAVLVAALSDPGNWETTQPVSGAALVSLRSTVAATELAAHPAGMLGVRQSALPLGLDLTHLGRAAIVPDRFDVTSVTVNGSTATLSGTRAPFAAGEFVDLSPDEKLSRPAFERFLAGFTAGGEAVVAGPATPADLTYEEIVIGPDGPVEPLPTRHNALAGVVAHGAALGAAATSPTRRDDVAQGLRAIPLVAVSQVTRVLVDAATLQPVPAPGLDPAATETELRQALAAMQGMWGSRLLVQAFEAAAVS